MYPGRVDTAECQLGQRHPAAGAEAYEPVAVSSNELVTTIEANLVEFDYAKGEGRFLYVYHYALALKSGAYADVADLPAAGAFYQEYLDRLGIVDHGVHPDVPKNVSKSITVD